MNVKQVVLLNIPEVLNLIFDLETGCCKVLDGLHLSQTNSGILIYNGWKLIFCTSGMLNSVSTEGCLKKEVTVPGIITWVGKIITACFCYFVSSSLRHIFCSSI
jgi:hypothetical protein